MSRIELLQRRVYPKEGIAGCPATAEMILSEFSAFWALGALCPSNRIHITKLKGREMDGDKETAGRYRHRAEEVRAIAEGVTDMRVRETLITVANDYDRMAQVMDTIAESDLMRSQRRPV